MTPLTHDREMEIRHKVRKAILTALQRDLDGDEQIMKEVWEDCYKPEYAIAEDELKKVIEYLGRMPW